MFGSNYKWAWAVLAFVLSIGNLGAQAILSPPFGLNWGDSPEKLITWATRHSMDLTISLPGDQPGLRVIRIEPRRGFLPETKAGAIEARFLTGRLYEVTIHYFDPKASANVMATRFAELRKHVTREHGKLLTNQQQRSVEDQFVTRTRSFHREPVKGLFLLLAFTEMEDLLRKSKDAKFSMIYRNDNFRKELEKKAKKP